MLQRFITDEEINTANAMMGWQFWFAPIVFGAVSLGLLLAYAFTRDPLLGFLLLCLGCTAILIWIVQLREHDKFRRDIQKRVVEVVEGAPEKVGTSRLGFCILHIAGRRVRVSNDHYGELREANAVMVAFLPESAIAVRVLVTRGIGL
ncbi:MAG: hypothetical protein C5B55_07465 [Blastocatellia bacterium]|nr:MAG: hypothetical protein C5B55_07465 [Blastocatellia bacterium]